MSSLENNKMVSSVKTLRKSIECSINFLSLFSNLAIQKNQTNRMLLESCEIESKQQLKSILMNKAALRIECTNNLVRIRAQSLNGENALHHLSYYFDRRAKIATNDTIQENRSFKEILIDYSTDSQNKDIRSTPKILDEDSRLKIRTPIDALRQIKNAFETSQGQPYGVFLCGLFSFDCIASFEKLPPVKEGKNTASDYVFYLAEEVLVYDHKTHRCEIYGNLFQGKDFEKNHNEQSRRIQITSNTIEKITNIDTTPEIGDCLSMNKSLNFSGEATETAKVHCDISDEAFQRNVFELKKQIASGNIFQVVPSRTFSLECRDTLLSYKELKQSNPSPYMFYMQDQDFTLFGASPESALKYQRQSNRVELYPIAGTRERGLNEDGSIDFDLDKRLEASLKLDTKEIAEHMMLVDLARNDIARISTPSSLQIPRLLEVDRYSHVMHLVSCVLGELRSDLDCFHAYQACMNMGTLTGAPKIKATELLRLKEKKRRGSYGGAVGYINALGDMDTCIVIRSAFCKDGIAHIQAGAGIVHDSDPVSESEETKNKAKAVMLAVKKANSVHAGAEAQ